MEIISFSQLNIVTSHISLEVEQKKTNFPLIGEICIHDSGTLLEKPVDSNLVEMVDMVEFVGFELVAVVK